VKFHLAKVTVCRQHVRQPDFAHDHEARAISKREILVTIPEEQLTGFLETIAIDTLPSEPGAPVDLLPPGFSGTQPESEAKECQRFVDDEIARNQGLAGLERSVPRRATSRVIRVCRIGARHPPCRVDEERFHRPYKARSWSAADRPSRDRPTASAR
jgi:hypothetical protein